MRKSTIITLEDEGKKLTFKIIQMSASQHERWQNRLLMLLAAQSISPGREKDNKGINVQTLRKKMNEWKNTMVNGEDAPKEVQGSESDKYLTLFQSIGSIGYDNLEPLYDELLSCVAHVPDPNRPDFTVQLTPENVDSIIGDWRNLYKLRIEALKLEYSFFKGGEPSPNQKQADIKIMKAM